MNITTINNNNTNFNGKLITKGKASEYLKNEILKNTELKKLASGENDILVKVKNKKETGYHVNHAKGDTLYQLSIEARKEKPSLVDKIKSFLELVPQVKISKNFHSEDTLVAIMEERVEAQKYAKKLNKEIIEL